MALRIGLAVGVLLLIAVFISTRDVPTGLEGRPEITVAFPTVADPGAVQTATFTVTNPGPGRMASLFLAFARVGPAQGGGELPYPIVDAGAKHENPAILSVEPEPEAVSLNAVVFRFEGLDEGETVTISFDLRVPEQTGPAANSVTAYPGEDPERAKGVRLETEVGG